MRMVAYNFQARFVRPIESGEKRQTIRRRGKRRHAEAGDKLQLYTGQRTKKCRKILEEDPTCIAVQAVTIRVGAFDVAVAVDGRWLTVEELDEFARYDGFADREDFHAFWLSFHGQGEADNLLIRW